MVGGHVLNSLLVAREAFGRMELGRERRAPVSIFVIDEFMVNLGNRRYASIRIAY